MSVACSAARCLVGAALLVALAGPQSALAQFGPKAVVPPRNLCHDPKTKKVCDCEAEKIPGKYLCITAGKPCVKGQVVGTNSNIYKITYAAKNGGKCPGKPGGKKGEEYKKLGGTCTAACGSSDPCMPGNPAKPYCQNNGVCSKGSVPPTCRCTAKFDGKQCEKAAAVPTPYCTGDPCQKRGTCVHLGAVNTCVNCTGSWTGPACAVDVCNPQGAKCKNGKCVVTTLKNSKTASCDCTGTGFVGPDCSIKSGAGNTPASLCASLGCGIGKSQGKCEVNVQYAKARCICKDNWSGPKCDINSKQTSKCDSVGTMNCVLGVKTAADPGTNDGKCQAYKEYAKCAQKYNCPGMLASWCAVYFKPSFGYCTLTACATPKTTCDMDIYKDCFVKFKKDVVDTNPNNYLDPCKTARHLSACALQASCYDLAATYCAFRPTQNKGYGCTGMPKECNNYKSEVSEADFALATEDLSWDHYEGTKKEAPKEESKGLLVVSVAMVLAGVALAAAVLVRRGRESEAQPVSNYEEL